MSPPYSLEECAEFYQEMLVDVLAASARFATHLGLDSVMAFHPPDAVHEMIALAPPDFRLQPQRGKDLGQRMAHAASEAVAAGARSLLIRGSDSPALPLICLEEALGRLESGDDVVLTPDQDGGYALIGLRNLDRRLFEIPMSTDTVLEQTLECARELGLVASMTRPTFGVNVVGDLQLLEEISPHEKADLCPHTVQYLSTDPGTRVL